MDQFQNWEAIDGKKYSRQHLEKVQRALEKRGEFIRVMSFNTLFDHYDYKLAWENRWENRKSRVIEMMISSGADIIGVQEPQSHQIQEIIDRLDDYTFFGEAGPNGEVNGIFYKTLRFKAVWGKTYPLCQKTALNGLTLIDRVTDKEVTIFNVHLAYTDIDLRQQEVDEVCAIIQPKLEQGAVILTGDFNSFPASIGEKYPFYDGDHLLYQFRRIGLFDAREASLVGHLGPRSTFTNRDNSTTPFEGTGSVGVFLDHVMVSQDVTVFLHAVNPSKVHGHFPSDHMPVLADVIL